MYVCMRVCYVLITVSVRCLHTYALAHACIHTYIHTHTHTPGVRKQPAHIDSDSTNRVHMAPRRSRPNIPTPSIRDTDMRGHVHDSSTSRGYVHVAAVRNEREATGSNLVFGVFGVPITVLCRFDCTCCAVVAATEIFDFVECG
jgi:hypothetical protein